MSGCKKRALARGIDFNISEQWLQDRLYEAADRCVVTGLQFDYSLRPTTSGSYSTR